MRESGRAYGRFAAVAGEAATTLGRLDSGGWVGSEGDLFRARAAEIPRTWSPITGPNGRTGMPFTAWQFDNGSTTPRMITNFLKVH